MVARAERTYREWVDRSRVDAYIARVDHVLASAQELFPLATPVAKVGPVEGGMPPPTSGASRLATGADYVASSYRSSWPRVAGLDHQGSAAVTAATINYQGGRDGATAVRRAAATAATAIAPAADSPAGMKLLVARMDAQMADMQRHIAAVTTRNTHVATQLDHVADGYRSVATAYVPPKPPPKASAGSMCWIGSKDGDVKRLCPEDTDTVTYVDDDGNYVSKSLSDGEITVMHRPGPVEGDPSVCWLSQPGADRSICGPGTTSWMYPGGGYLITEETGPDGRARIAFQTPLGPLTP